MLASVHLESILFFSVLFFFFFNDTATTEIYTLSLHDALPISRGTLRNRECHLTARCRPRGRSEEHTSELQSRGLISYAVFCLKKKKNMKPIRTCIPIAIPCTVTLIF